MKNYLYFKPLLLCGFILLFLCSSCNDSKTTIDTADLNVECHNFDNYEHYSTQMYEYLKYHIAEADPITLIPEDSRDLVLSEWSNRKTKDMDFLQVLDYMESEEIIRSEMKSELSELRDFIETKFYETSTPDLSYIASSLLKRIEDKKSEETLLCEERKMLIISHYIYEGFFRYFAEVFPPNDAGIMSNSVDVRGCSIWELYSCFWESFGLGIVEGLAVSFELSNFFLIVSSMPATGAGGALYGGIRGIIYVIDGEGPCCDADLDCKAVMGVSLSFTNCTPTASYTAWGFGVDDTSLSWSNDNGTPATATTPTSNPRSTITQTGATPVVTTIASMCSDGTARASDPFTRDLTQEFKKVTGVAVAGADSVSPGSSFAYSALGISANYSVQWIVTGGTITSTSASGNEIIINWGSGIATTPGSVQCQVNNNCPGGHIRVLTIAVTGDGPPE